MTSDDAYSLLEAIAQISNTTDKLKKVAKTAKSTQTIKRPAIDFAKCGIPVGAELVYTEDSSVRVTVADNRKVQYNDELTSLSAIVKGFKGYNVAGPSYFTYNGELITDIAERTQWSGC